MNKIYYGNKLLDTKRLFLGECFGVALTKRGPDDNHVIVWILVEDDGNWLISKNGMSSCWITDLQNQLDKAKKWIQDNCIEERYGWKFRE